MQSLLIIKAAGTLGSKCLNDKNFSLSLSTWYIRESRQLVLHSWDVRYDGKICQLNVRCICTKQKTSIHHTSYELLFSNRSLCIELKGLLSISFSLWLPQLTYQERFSSSVTCTSLWRCKQDDKKQKSQSILLFSVATNG